MTARPEGRVRRRWPEHIRARPTSPGHARSQLKIKGIKMCMSIRGSSHRASCISPPSTTRRFTRPGRCRGGSSSSGRRRRVGSAQTPSPTRSPGSSPP
eukprot:16445597-Heterocapsa_arctica.AAC.1